MALIICEECGKEISDTTKRCIHCGKKIRRNNMIENKEKHGLSKKYIYALASILLIIMIIILCLIFSKDSNRSYIGKWEHNIIWQKNGKTIREGYAYYEFLDNNTFIYNGYSKNNDKMNYTGTYTETDGVLYTSFEYNGEKYSNMLYFSEDKLCVNKEACEDYFVKSTSELKNTITIDEPNNYISYQEYQNILNNKEMAIVIVFDDNSHSNNYKNALSQVVNKYKIPFYYYKLYNNDNKLNINATPTTLIINNGKVVDKLLGFAENKTINELDKKIKNLATENDNNNTSNNNSNSNNNNNSNNSSNNSNSNNNNNSNNSNNNSSSNNNNNTSKPTPKPNPTPTPTPEPNPTPEPAPINYKITSISGIGDTFKTRYTECRVDNFTAKIINTVLEDKIKVEYSITMTKTKKLNENRDFSCKVRIYIYDSSNMVVGSHSQYFDMEVNEAAKKNNYFYIERSGTDYSIKLKQE